MSGDTPWSGRLAFGPWWFLYSGPLARADVHSHLAFQLVLHGGNPIVADAGHRPLPGPVVVIEPGTPHSIRDDRDHGIIVFIDARCAAGDRLRRGRIESPRLVRVHPVSAIAGSLRLDNWSRAEEAVHRLLDHICGDEQRPTMSWWRHPTIDGALARRGAGAVDVDQLAADIGIPSSRLAHLFSHEIGTPLQAYARWLRLLTATEQLTEGVSIAQAGNEVGFSDQLEFTQTFQATFGLTPADAARLGHWMRR